MKNSNYFLLILLISSIFILGCDQDPKDKQVYDENFCTRYSTSFPGCWCIFDNLENDGLGEYQDGALYKSGRIVSNVNDAEAFFNKWLYTTQTNYYNIDLIDNDTRIECQDLGHGFYNCFIFNKFYVTVSDDGDIYKTECGI